MSGTPTMRGRPLVVEGAYEFVPRTFSDDRGLFVAPFQGEAFAEVMGRHRFPVAQTNHSRSRRNVVRGVHLTRVPPGTAKYVYCARGRALDMVVDLRLGSPTYGRYEAVVMDQVDFRAMYLPVGVGHAFVALEDDTTMSYILSESYVAEYELSVSVLDPTLGLSLPDSIEPVMSERDTNAPTLAEAEATGLLADYALCQRIEEDLWSR